MRGLPQVSSGGNAPGAEGRRAAPNPLPAWEAPENVRPGQSWGAGGRGGRSPAPLPPSPDKWAAGRRRAGGRRQPVEERGPLGPLGPVPGPVPCRAQRSLSAGPPRSPSHVNGRIPRGAGAGGSGLSSLPRGPPDGRGPGGQGAGAGPREGGRGSPVRLMLALPAAPGLARAPAGWWRRSGLREGPRAPFPFPPSAAGGAGGFSPAAAPSLPPRHGRSPTAARDGREPEGEEPRRLAGQPGLGAAPQPQPPFLLPLAW